MILLLQTNELTMKMKKKIKTESKMEKAYLMMIAYGKIKLFWEKLISWAVKIVMISLSGIYEN